MFYPTSDYQGCLHTSYTTVLQHRGNILQFVDHKMFGYIYICALNLPCLKSILSLHFRLVNQSKECMQLVEEARLYHLLPDRRSEFGTTKRCQPRKNAGTAQVIENFK